MTRREFPDLPGRLPPDLLPRRGERVLCAVSGGLDSMCLLDLLDRRCRDCGAALFAAHFNHRLRGAASEGDEAFVAEACARMGIPLTAEGADAAACAREAGESVEEAGRRLRYAFFRRTAEALGCTWVYTAHHANDNAETVLWNLIRGTGLKGLTGIPRQQGPFRRPLLEVTRRELEAYAAGRGLDHVEDATNADPDAASRNFLRLRVLPLLEELNPGAAEHIARTAAILAREDQALDVLAEMEESSAIRDSCGRVCVLTGVLEDWPRAASERMVLRILGRTAGRRRDFTARHVEAVLALAPGKSLDLPHGVLVRRVGDAIWFEKAASLRSAVSPMPDGEGTVSFGAWTVRLSAEAGETGQGICYPLRLTDAPLSVTCWRREDRMRLPGARGSRSLKRLFAERGISPQERDRLPVLRAGDAPIAVPGVGVDTAFSPEAGEPAVFVTFQKIQSHSEKDRGGRA